MTFKEQIKAGGAFLDFIYGDEWVDKIDLESLDLRTPSFCILGQTDSDYYSHANVLGLGPVNEDITSSLDTIAFGFSLPLKYQGSFPLWDQLTREWKNFLIKRRRKQRRNR